MMGYVVDLRQTVGHQPLVVVGAAAVVLTPAGLLLVKRRDNQLWGLPAGSKELNEETGLRGTQPQLLTVVSGPGMQYTYPNGDQIDSVTTVYRLTATGELKTSDETSAVRYVPLERLPEQLTPITRHILEQLTGMHAL